jgi:hypothetical protein
MVGILTLYNSSRGVDFTLRVGIYIYNYYLFSSLDTQFHDKS